MTMKADRRDVRRGSGGGRPAKTHEVTEKIPVTPQMYQRLTAKIAGRPEERILSYLMLRSLKQARYSEENVGHFALAATNYTHFTSPIRRYPDLIVHRILKDVLRKSAEKWDGNAPEGANGPSTEAFPVTASGEGLRSFSPQRDRRDTDATLWSKRREHAAHESEPMGGPISLDELHDIAEESSQSERRADDAERELMEWKK